MTTEEKIDQILSKLEAKKDSPKPKDGWDKAQIVVTAFTGMVALILTIITFSVTTHLSEQANQQAQSFQIDQLKFQKESTTLQQALQRNEDTRKEREEFIQEISVLPQLSKLKGDKELGIIAKQLLAKLQSNPIWKDTPIGLYAKSPIDKPSKSGKFKTPSAPKGEPFWVYLGEGQNGTWQTKYFNINELPKASETITSIANVFERDVPPKLVSETDNWLFGKTLGVLKKGATVRVLQTVTLAEDIHWAKVVRF